MLGIVLFLIGLLNETAHSLSAEILRSFGVGIAVFGITSFIQSAILAKASADQLREARDLLSTKLDVVVKKNEEQLEEARSLFSTRLDGVLDESKRQLGQISDILTDIQLQQFAHLRDQLDKQLNRVFLDFISDWVNKIYAVAKRQEMILEGDDVDLFRHFYRRTLQAFPARGFLATSLASREYFWKENQTLNQAISKFINEDGGRMERVFYMEGGIDVEISDEEADVIEEQLEMKISVFVVSDSAVYKHLKKFFVVEENGAIAWEVFAHVKEITRVVATSDTDRTSEYLKIYHELKARASEVSGVSRNPNMLALKQSAQRFQIPPTAVGG